MKIGKKLIIYMLALTLGMLLLVNIGLFAVIADLKDNTQQMYDNLKTDAEQTIEEGLYAQDSDSLGVLADTQTEVTDSRLRIVAINFSNCGICPMFANSSNRQRT